MLTGFRLKKTSLLREQGYYLYPDLYGQPEEKGVNRLLFPEEQKPELLINENKPT
jgi:hypothetical protein